MHFGNKESMPVFPAHAGMFLHGRFSSPSRLSFPRARGDVPAISSTQPTTQRFPRARGDVPSWRRRLYQIRVFSPRTRGCSLTPREVLIHAVVFPAHAGMFLESPSPPSPVVCFPRARGDVPFLHVNAESAQQFSPRTRGCS